MGYNTRYELSVLNVAELPEELLETQVDGDYASIKALVEGYADVMKWYEHEEEMAALSLRFPDYVFELSGEGEDQGDVWVKWFKAGKVWTRKAELKVPDMPGDVKALLGR